jgi:hypothetical protein
MTIVSPTVPIGRGPRRTVIPDISLAPFDLRLGDRDPIPIVWPAGSTVRRAQGRSSSRPSAGAKNGRLSQVPTADPLSGTAMSE